VDPKDFQIMHDSIVSEFRQALADCQLALATANAQVKVKDRIIAELTDVLEIATTPAD
jgi:tRNA C32,U32 (ribose-2'-O)-methylase TrmJ